jgi:hypothetical protein
MKAGRRRKPSAATAVRAARQGAAAEARVEAKAAEIQARIVAMRQARFEANRSECAKAERRRQDERMRREALLMFDWGEREW